MAFIGFKPRHAIGCVPTQGAHPCPKWGKGGAHMNKPLRVVYMDRSLVMCLSKKSGLMVAPDHWRHWRIAARSVCGSNV